MLALTLLLTLFLFNTSVLTVAITSSNPFSDLDAATGQVFSAMNLLQTSEDDDNSFDWTDLVAGFYVLALFLASLLAMRSCYQLATRYIPRIFRYSTASWCLWSSLICFRSSSLKHHCQYRLQHLARFLILPTSLGLPEAVYMHRIGSNHLQIVHLRVELKTARQLAATNSKEAKKMKKVALQTALKAKLEAQYADKMKRLALKTAFEAKFKADATAKIHQQELVSLESSVRGALDPNGIYADQSLEYVLKRVKSRFEAESEHDTCRDRGPHVMTVAAAAALAEASQSRRRSPGQKQSNDRFRRVLQGSSNDIQRDPGFRKQLTATNEALDIERQRTADLSQRSSVLTTTLETLEWKLTAYQAANKRSQTMQEDSEKQIAELSMALEDTVKLLDNEKSRTKSLSERLSAANHAVRTAQQDLDAKIKANDELNKANAALKAQIIDDANDDRAEIQRLRNESAAAKLKIESLTSQLATSQNEIKAKDADLKKARRENSSFREDLEAAKVQLDSSKSNQAPTQIVPCDHQAAIDAFQKQLTEARSENSALRIEHASIVKSHKEEAGRHEKAWNARREYLEGQVTYWTNLAGQHYEKTQRLQGELTTTTQNTAAEAMRLRDTRIADLEGRLTYTHGLLQANDELLIQLGCVPAGQLGTEVPTTNPGPSNTDQFNDEDFAAALQAFTRGDVDDTGNAIVGPQANAPEPPIDPALSDPIEAAPPATEPSEQQDEGGEVTAFKRRKDALGDVMSLQDRSSAIERQNNDDLRRKAKGKAAPAGPFNFACDAATGPINTRQIRKPKKPSKAQQPRDATNAANSAPVNNAEPAEVDFNNLDGFDFDDSTPYFNSDFGTWNPNDPRDNPFNLDTWTCETCGSVLPTFYPSPA